MKSLKDTGIKAAKGWIFMGILCTGLALGGCSDNLGTAPEGSSSTGAVQQEPMLSETAQQIRQYEIKYGAGEFEPADYLALAGLYGSQGQVRKQRDLLEQSFRLNRDEAAFSALGEITVNIQEETEEIRSQAGLMLQNLSLEEYRDEAVNMLNSSEWFPVMMPKLYEGSRKYYLEDANTQSGLRIQVGYGQSGGAYSEIWYTDGTGQVLYLKKEEDSIQMLLTGQSEGLYQGDYESWLCVGSTGDIYHERGTFTQGVCVGEYTADVHFGSAGVDLFSLWSNRQGMEFTAYKGEFDRDGKTLLEQPSDSKLDAVRGTAEGGSVVVYAYDQKEKNFLFLRTDGAEEAVFDAAAFGFGALPSYTPYEIYQDTVSDGDAGEDDGQSGGGGGSPQPAAEAQVRVYDGNIEWFDGEVWKVLGSVEAFEAQDPFLTYEQERNGQASGISGESGSTGEGGTDGAAGGEEGGSGTYDRLGAGSIEKPKSGSSKPNTNKPSGSGSGQTQKPGSGGNEGSGDASITGGGDSGSPGGNTGGGDSGSSGGNTGGGDSGSSGDNTGGGNSGNTGGNTGGGDSGSTGGDVDVEWTPDIL